MKPRDFIDRLDDDKIVEEIALAEQSTSGEIRVFVSSRQIHDAYARAQRRFEKLGMHKTRERNAVLLYFAPHSHKFAVIGDRGIHQKCGQAFWDEVVADLEEHLRAERFTEAVIHGVRKAGAVLARHFPRGDKQADELPNRIGHD